MSREKETYRDHCERLYVRFGNVELISLAEAATYLGVDTRTLQRDKSFPLRKVGRQSKVSIINLARWLAA